MNRLAELVVDTRVAWGIVVVVALVTAFSLGLAAQLKQEDDVLSFLPANNPDIATFQDINQEFGGLDAALVGIETEDVFINSAALVNLGKTKQSDEEEAQD